MSERYQQKHMQQQEFSEENQRKYSWKKMGILLKVPGSGINKIRTLYISVLWTNLFKSQFTVDLV